MAIGIFSKYWLHPRTMNFERAPMTKMILFNGMLKIFVNFVSPLVLWITEVCCLTQDWSASVKATVGFLAGLNVIMTILTNYFLYDSMPNGSLAAVLDIEKSAWIYALNKIIMIIRTYAIYGNTGFVRVWLQTVSIFLSLASVSYIITARLYWRLASIRAVMVSHYLLFMFGVIAILQTNDVSNKKIALLAVVFSGFAVIRTVVRLECFSNQDIFDKKLRSVNRVFSIMTMEQLFSKKVRSKKDNYQIFYFTGLLNDRFRRFPHKKHADIDLLKQKDRAEFIVASLSSESKDFRILQICYCYLLLYPFEIFHI